MDEFHVIRGKIYEDLQVVHEKLDQVKEKVRASLKSEQNPDGLLTRGEQAYVKCLELQKEQLEVLFSEDEAHWRENLEEANKGRSRIAKQI